MKLHDLEKENLALKSRADEVEHKSKVDVSNVKMEMLRERGELEREHDRMRNQIEELKTQLDLAQHNIDQQAATLVEKERESVKRVQAAREEEWTKLQKLETEK